MRWAARKVGWWLEGIGWTWPDRYERIQLRIYLLGIRIYNWGDRGRRL